MICIFVKGTQQSELGLLQIKTSAESILTTIICVQDEIMVWCNVAHNNRTTSALYCSDAGTIPLSSWLRVLVVLFFNDIVHCSTTSWTCQAASDSKLSPNDEADAMFFASLSFCWCMVYANEESYLRDILCTFCVCLYGVALQNESDYINVFPPAS